MPINTGIDFVSPSFRLTVVHMHIGTIDVVPKICIEVPSDTFTIDTYTDIRHRKMINLLVRLMACRLVLLPCSKTINVYAELLHW